MTDIKTETPSKPLANHNYDTRIVIHLRNHLKDMDSRITLARMEIREKQAAIAQLEKEKWSLDSEVDKIEKIIAN